tara:strand:+ start:332 stop:475 length:144 start_codon:yes stop_codon:yes gene_type:complete
MKRPTGHVLDSIKRQYKGGKDYTIEDKKNVINWYKIQAKKKTNSVNA